MFRPKFFRIMVTDVNHHIRDFLKRELEQEGYTVSCISCGVEACRCIREPDCFDLVILDPELLLPYDHSLLWEVMKQDSPPQIIVHLYDDYLSEMQLSDNIQVVEKNGSSIGVIKEKVWRCYAVMAGA